MFVLFKMEKQDRDNERDQAQIRMLTQLVETQQKDVDECKFTIFF